MSARYSLLRTLVLVSVFWTQPVLAATPALEIRERLAATIPAEMARRDLPGVAVVVVDPSGVVFARGYGVADRETGQAVDVDRTVFRVASVSKLFTATAVMQLVERGTLDLDQPVGRYLAGLTLPPDVAREVTPRHLLTHTAGFGARFLGYHVGRPADLLPLRTYLGTRLPEPFIAPGQIISYANHGSALAGLVVESADGRPFEDYVDEEILSVLSMHDSGFRPGPRLTGALASGYVRAAGGLARVPLTFQHATPAGALVATASDLARFAQAFLSHGRGDSGTILTPDSVAAMLSRQFTHHPRVTGVGLAFFEHVIDGSTAWGHDGDTGGHNSRLLLVPRLDVAIVVTYSGSDPTKRFAEAVTRTVLGAYEAAPATAPLSEVEAPAGLRERVVGTYRWTRYARDTAEKGFMPYPFFQYRVAAGDAERIVIAQTPIQLGPPVRLRFVGDRLFQSDDGRTLASFREDDTGRVSHLLYNGTGVLPMAFERIPWFRTAEAQGFALLLFLAGFALAGTWATWRELRGRAQLGGRCVLFVSAANLAFLALFPAAFGLAWFSDYFALPVFLAPSWPPAFTYGASAVARGLLALPLVGLAASVVWVGWRASRGSSPQNGWVIGFVILELAFALFLFEWNLLGYRL